MDKTSKQGDDWKIIDWRVIAKNLISPSRAWRFIKRRVPQLSAIWAAVAILLRIPLFVSAFDDLGRNIRSTFFTVGASAPIYRSTSLWFS